MDELKSCPFCGEAPISFPSGDGSGLMIECVTPDCVRPHVSYIPPAAAIAKWNTRSPREGEAERIRRALVEQTGIVDRLCSAIERTENDIGGESVNTVLALLGPANDRARVALKGVQ